ncbi:copper resistance CopC family protein [Streptomyces sp. NPDC042207]|uniref:copper resistance CopC/CopD family protein n=1 Tax=Streptomyces sp. NPDC042207 TaxID=3154331 RepID=UPI00340BAFC5
MRRGRVRRRRLGKLTLLGAVLVLLLLGGASPASAHAALRGADPADGTVLKSAPGTVTLSFTESVSLLDDSFRLFDPEGRRVPTGEPQHAPGRPDTARVAFPGGLGEGTFTMAWRVVSADSHPVSGAFTFSVGKPSPTTAAIDTGPAENPTTRGLYDLARYTSYGAAALLIGTAAFALLCRPPHTGPLRKPLVAGWWALLASTLALLVLRAPYETGTGPASAFDPAAFARTLTGRPGLVLLTRLALLAPVALLLVRLSRRRPEEKPSRASLAAGAALALALALTWAGSEHASAGIQVPVAMTSSVLHLLAMAVWLGGLTALLTTLQHATPDEPETGRAAPPATRRKVPPASPDGDPEPRAKAAVTVAAEGSGGRTTVAALKGTAATGASDDAATTAAPVDGPVDAAAGAVDRSAAGASEPSADGPALTAPVVRFSRIAFGAVVVLVVTGVYQSWRGLGSWTTLTGTEYGRLLLVKLVVVAMLLAVAARSRRWTARLVTADAADTDPAASDGKAPAEDPGTKTSPSAPDVCRRALRRSVLAEVAVGIAVLVFTTVLAGTLPGRAAAEAAQATPVAGVPGASVTVIPFDVGTPGGHGKVQITLEPGRVGQNAVEAVVYGPDGGLTTVPELRLSLSLPARNIGPIDAALTNRGGYWGTDTLNLPIPGTWTMKATVRVSEIDQASEERKVHIPR